MGSLTPLFTAASKVQVMRSRSGGEDLTTKRKPREVSRERALSLRSSRQVRIYPRGRTHGARRRSPALDPLPGGRLP